MRMRPLQAASAPMHPGTRSLLFLCVAPCSFMCLPTCISSAARGNDIWMSGTWTSMQGGVRRALSHAPLARPTTTSTVYVTLAAYARKRHERHGKHGGRLSLAYSSNPCSRLKYAGEAAECACARYRQLRHRCTLALAHSSSCVLLHAPSCVCQLVSARQLEGTTSG